MNKKEIERDYMTLSPRCLIALAEDGALQHPSIVSLNNFVISGRYVPMNEPI